MKKLLLTLSGLLLTLGIHSFAQTSEIRPSQPGNLQMGDYGFLYCHMSDRGQWTAYALSRDGLNYQDLLGGDSIFSAFEMAGIEHGTRDAYICRKFDGSGYLMVTTDMNNSMTKRLHKKSDWHNYGINLLTSDDLIHWQSTTFDFRKGLSIFSDPEAVCSVSEVEANARINRKNAKKIAAGKVKALPTDTAAYRDFSEVCRVWAPQIFWDADYVWPDGTQGGYFIYYSMWNPSEEAYDRMYYSYADHSFTRMTQPRVLFDWGYATIDADINWLPTDSLYHLMIKKEGGKPGLFTSTAPALTGPWSLPVDDDYVNFEGNKKCEGVSAFQIPGEEGWRIAYIEYSSKPRNYRICRADKNMRNFHSPQNIQGVTGPQHGSFMRLTKEEYDRLQAWSDAMEGKFVAPVASVPNPWKGKRVGFLGDSMTDPNNNATQYYYYTYMQDSLGIVPRVYARSGNKWKEIYQRATDMISKEGDALDAIFIFAGTNDFFHSVPMDDFYADHDTIVNVNGQMVPRKHRVWNYSDDSFCGRLNKVLSMLKHRYPQQQIVVMTPIHRAYANFSDVAKQKYNIQPNEDFSNAEGLYIEDYVHAIKQACEYWSVPCIDLFTLSGLYPLDDSYTQFFANPETDRLHPNEAGHIRLGQTIVSQLKALPATFKR